jgi:TonB family protein
MFLTLSSGQGLSRSGCRQLQINSRARFLVGLVVALILHFLLLSMNFHPPLQLPFPEPGTARQQVTVILHSRQEQSEVSGTDRREAAEIQPLAAEHEIREISATTKVVKESAADVGPRPAAEPEPTISSLGEGNPAEPFPAMEKSTAAASSAKTFTMPDMPATAANEAAGLSDTPREKQDSLVRLAGDVVNTETTGITAAPDSAWMRDAVPLYQSNPPPVYPVLAKKRGYEGVVVLRVLVNSDGTVGDVQVDGSSGYGILDRAAGRSVSGWVFVPALRYGKPAAMRVKVPVRFTLHDKANPTN